MTERIAMSWDFIQTKLWPARSYWICTSRPDGRPHAAPVWGVWHTGRLFFGTSPTSVKARNIARTGLVSVHLESADFVVSFEGAARVEDDEQTLRVVRGRYNDKYALQTGGPVMPEQETPEPMLAVTPTVGFTWLEAAFAQTMTRWEFDEPGEPPRPVEISYG